MDKTSKVWFDAASNLLRPAHAQQDMLSGIMVSVKA
jgi:hypothetical protein